MPSYDQMNLLEYGKTSYNTPAGSIDRTKTTFNYSELALQPHGGPKGHLEFPRTIMIKYRLFWTQVGSSEAPLDLFRPP